MTEIEIIPAETKHRELIAGLMNLYLYDFSVYTGEDCDEKGWYHDGNLHRYWAEPGRYPFLIRYQGKYAGFVLVRDVRNPDDGQITHHIAEFFVMHRFRRKEVGLQAAWAVFDRFPGHWYVAEMEENLPAQAFWRKVISQYTDGNFKDTRVEEWEGPVQIFHSRLPGKNMANTNFSIEERLEQLGLVLPAAVQPPAGVRLPFAPVRVRGNRAYISGHGPFNPDGSIAGPFGRVGAEVSIEEAVQAAKLTALSILGSLKRELGSLERVSAWLRVFGMVNSAPGFDRQPQVINGFSDLILSLYGPERGAHARSAVGMAELPFNLPVEIEAEVEID